jgi:hypothetical protein
VQAIQHRVDDYFVEPADIDSLLSLMNEEFSPVAVRLGNAALGSSTGFSYGTYSIQLIGIYSASARVG